MPTIQEVENLLTKHHVVHWKESETVIQVDPDNYYEIVSNDTDTKNEFNDLLTGNFRLSGCILPKEESFFKISEFQTI